MRSGGNRRGQLQAANRLLDIFVQSFAADQRGPGAAEQAAFAAAGGIEAAVQLLQSGTPAMQEAAFYLLTGVCMDNAQCTGAVVAAGGIAAMLGLLRPASSAAVKQPDPDAARSFAVLLDESSIASQAAAEAGAIEVLVQLWQDDKQQDFDLWESVAVALAALARLSDEHAAAIAAHGATEPLVQLLLTYDRHSLNPETALAALAALCDGSPERTAAVMQAGAVPAVVRCLSNPSSSAQNNAAVLLHIVLNACPQARAAVVSAGGNSQLQMLLGSSDSGSQQRAAAALASLAAAGQQQATVAQLAAVTDAPAQPARPPRICAAPGCGATRGLRRCGGCGTVRYCSTECSRVHWRAHKPACRRLQAERAAAARAAPEVAEGATAADASAQPAM
ncbi:hypothetical protein COHA_004085 [Chlorella ohadii]|uniref:MYND-type domain-containing protein n=1 Tax=Chlorella ohadii TaxID=2649997 RepID=A0AAD5DUD6_9CHLO|nr:hypothetical protein COHA_004085 [Chlorella ohadii]